MSLDLSVDNEAALAWLDGALGDAVAQGQMVLVTYLDWSWKIWCLRWS
jgi:hypothetical protein